MPVKIFVITDPEEGERRYKEWVDANIGVKIITRHLCAHTLPIIGLEGTIIVADRLYVFYDSPGEAGLRRDQSLIEQNAQWEMCLDVAKTLGGDAHYSLLKNKEQRRLYLLNTYNLPKDDAEVIDTILQMDKLGVLNAKSARKE